MSEYIDKRTRITADNAGECAMALRMLEKERDRLRNSIRVFPLEITFADLRYVLHKPEQYDALIECLEDLLLKYVSRREAERDRAEKEARQLVKRPKTTKTEQEQQMPRRRMDKGDWCAMVVGLVSGFALMELVQWLLR